jgi:hypothetical protein
MADVPGVVGGVIAGAETLFPILTPFNPLFEILLTAIKAHYTATGQWPTSTEVVAALPADIAKLQATWASWKPSGDGT